ncbi:GntR family transcriptional regulator [Paucisalibacillus globulus]|uniref:GntR family transcriptional regulator n=1 Tax=Paucisalibacillus globulus TaxID=351095 RepID=UPI000BB907EB|nr:GntR family transcriptional regulator [Paucisalibacillus globulus]
MLENDPKGKKPLYINVYDQLYKQIIDGNFPRNSKLPTENELAKSLGVSRVTLRQAISLLQDDGLIKSIQGKGNFITNPQPKNMTAGLEKIGNPIEKCHSEKIDDVEIEFRLDLESDYTRQVLNRKAAAVVAIERWYKSNGNIVAYAFTFMAIEAVTELNIDLHNEKQLLNMLEGEIYELANTATLEIKHSTSVNSSTQKHTIIGGEKCDLILESLYRNDKYPIAYNKFYIPVEFSLLKINATK